MATASSTRTKVFISYSHADKDWLERLKRHLKPLVREGYVDYWDDTNIKSGDDWQQEIRTALGRAQVAVLLISADFFASDFIDENELPPLLAAAEAEGVRILPVILSASRFARHPSLARFQAVNSPDRPLNDMPRAEQETVLDRLVETIESAVNRPAAEMPPIGEPLPMPKAQWTTSPPGKSHKYPEFVAHQGGMLPANLLQSFAPPIQSYVPTMAQLLSRPSGTISEKCRGSEEDTLSNALVFGSLSLLLGFALQVPLLAEDESLLGVVTPVTMFKFIVTFVIVFILLAIFRLFGGNGSLRQTFAAYLYFICPLYLFMIIIMLITMGLLRTYFPQLGTSEISAILWGRADPSFWHIIASNTTIAVVFIVLTLMPLVAFIVWTALCWGGFRSVHGLSRTRGIIVYILFIAAWYVVVRIMTFAVFGLFSGSTPSIV